MATPLKDVYDEGFLLEFGRRIQSVYPSFDIQAFVASVMGSVSTQSADSPYLDKARPVFT